MRTRRLSFIGAAAASALLAGCGASAQQVGPSSSPPSVEPPSPTATPTATPAERIVADMDPFELARTVVVGTAPGTDPASLASYVSSGPGGIILMGDNVPPSPGALADVTRAVAGAGDPDPLVAIDQEGGVVSRMPWDDLPSAATLRDAEPAEVEGAFARRGALLADAGATVNFGIVADVPRSESSFIFSRAFGTDPSRVAGSVAAAVEGERGGVASTLKHFPGHGAAEGDSHHAVPETDMPYDEWRAFDALPFEAGIDAGAELVMTGHLLFTAVDDEPASLSDEWYRILREDLGFDGVAVTDDLGMLLAPGDHPHGDPATLAVDALAAGADLVLMVAGSTPETASEMIDGIARATHDGSLSRERLVEAAERVIALRLAYDD